MMLSAFALFHKKNFYCHVISAVDVNEVDVDEDQPNFILQLYSSMDFGRKWQLVHDNVMPGRFYWYDYVHPIFERFRTVINFNLHNDSVHDCKLSGGSRDLLSKTYLTGGSRAQNGLYPCHVDMKEYCAFFSPQHKHDMLFLLSLSFSNLNCSGTRQWILMWACLSPFVMACVKL